MIQALKKTKVIAVAALAACALGMLALAGCASNDAADSGSDAAAGSTGAQGAISVISREDGSGTRGAFTELFKVLDENKNDMTTTGAVITNSTSVMMTTVAGDVNSIGYISLGSLNDTVKAVDIDGVTPTAEGVKDGSYKVARPFNVVTKDGMSETAQDFLNFIMSKEGQDVITKDGYVSIADSASSYKATGAKGKVVVAGSSSVTPVMEKACRSIPGTQPRREHRSAAVRLLHGR